MPADSAEKLKERYLSRNIRIIVKRGLLDLSSGWEQTMFTAVVWCLKV
jgi:hypothetical protein